jgi:hypothetical protein
MWYATQQPQLFHKKRRRGKTHNKKAESKTHKERSQANAGEKEEPREN